MQGEQRVKRRIWNNQGMQEENFFNARDDEILFKFNIFCSIKRLLRFPNEKDAYFAVSHFAAVCTENQFAYVEETVPKYCKCKMHQVEFESGNQFYQLNPVSFTTTKTFQENSLLSPIDEVPSFSSKLVCRFCTSNIFLGTTI